MLADLGHLREAVFNVIGEAAAALWDSPRPTPRPSITRGRCFVARRRAHAIARLRDNQRSSFVVEIQPGTVVRIEADPTDDQVDVLLAPLDSFIVHIVPAEHRARAAASGILFSLPVVMLQEAFAPDPRETR
jgi:hypothetical protein